MSSYIDDEATDEEIEEWFVSTPREDQISGLARTIRGWEWGKDLSRLRLAEREFTEKELVELLETEVEVYGWSYPVIHHLVYNNHTSTFTSLLDGVTSHHHLLSLISLKGGHLQLNVLSKAVGENYSTIYNYIKNRISDDEFYLLLCERGRDGRTGLHWAVRVNNLVSEVLSLVKDETRIHHLLSIRDDVGRTVLSRSIYDGGERTFQSIISHYDDKQQELLDLASIPDSWGNTSFHRAAGRRTSNYLITLLRSTYSLNTRDQLSAVLSLRNASGGKERLRSGVDESHPDNELIYDWMIDSLTNNRYLLFELPSVLVMYTTVGRENAETEAHNFISSLETLGLRVKSVKNFTEQELLEEIKESQESRGRNGQIVALMSHGFKGCIADKTGRKIRLKDIEEKMCEVADETPKVLILQCCQTGKRVKSKLQSVSTQTEEQTTSNTLVSHTEGVAAAGGPVNQEETTAAGEEPLEEYETPQPCTEDGGGSSYKYETFYPTSRHFCLLTSCIPSQPSRRNKFIPALADALIKLKPDQNLATLMLTVKQTVRNATCDQQAPHSIDFLEWDLCMKNILPIYLSIKRSTEDS